jgi:hypothetical protein
LLGKPIFDGNIFSLNPSKLAQLLPERVNEDRTTGSGASIQETYAENFCRLLRLGGRAKRKEHGTKCKTNDALADY